MSEKNVQCLSFISRHTPNMKELTSLLPRVGFKSLKDATSDDLPKGCIVVLFNSYTCSFETIIARKLKNGVLHFYHQNTFVGWKDTTIVTEAAAAADYFFKVIS